MKLSELSLLKFLPVLSQLVEIAAAIASRQGGLSNLQGLHHVHLRNGGSSHELEFETLGYFKEHLDSTLPAAMLSQRIRIKYPAVDLPSIDEPNINGMYYFNYDDTVMPCHDCLILQMSSDIEYENGTQANVDTGVSLHHALFLNSGRLDHVCGTSVTGQRFFATGNERTTLDMGVYDGQVGGYPISETDKITARGEIMNMRRQRQRVVFSTTYEFVPISRLPHSEIYVRVWPVWLDVGTCTDSRVRLNHDPSADHALSVFASPNAWTSHMAGKVIFAGGHLHDSGISVQIFKDGDLVCENFATYSTETGLESRQDNIQNISTCSDFTATIPGSHWTIKAFYDTSLHQPAKAVDGSLQSVMGISIMYIASTEPDELGTFKQALGTSTKQDSATREGQGRSWIGAALFGLMLICLIATAATISFER